MIKRIISFKGKRQLEFSADYTSDAGEKKKPGNRGTEVRPGNDLGSRDTRASLDYTDD